MTEILLRDDADAVATLTLNRPEALNPLSEEMLAALQTQFDALMHDNSVRVVVLKGAGRAFCAGHDLKQMQAQRQTPDGGRAYYAQIFAQCARMMTTIPRLPQPALVAVRQHDVEPVAPGIEAAEALVVGHAVGGDHHRVHR